MAENTTAKIQVRRGNLEDLPILAEGELGYALDYRRLFVGNEPIRRTGNGTDYKFTIQDRHVITGQLSVNLNGYRLTNQFDQITTGQTPDYNIEGTDIVFATAPAAGTEIVISSNTEIVTQAYLMDMSYSPLYKNVLNPSNAGLNFNLSTYNTGFIEYSIKNTQGAMRLGTLKLIVDTNTNTVHVDDISTGIGYTDVVFGGKVENNRFFLTYVNRDNSPLNFHYSIKLWNTI